ncbi:MAG: SLC13 family permease [Anaerolinea sp.]|nr:SLC13 family permease [Anaerolinea sp.]
MFSFIDPIFVVITILLIAVVLFVTEKLRMDLVALLVLGALAVTGLVTPTQALSGFSSPAVVTVWAMFIISGGLSVTGVAQILGRQMMRLAGEGEARLVVVIMSIAGLMSAVMNNVGVAAMLLPVVINIARQTKRPSSKLLMPLAMGSLLGGLTTLIGTPPNILVSDALRDYGLQPFGLFDFTPIGLTIMVSGIAFVALVGRHLLPTRDPVQELAANGAGAMNGAGAPNGAGNHSLRGAYEIDERLSTLALTADSPLVGQSLAASRLGSALRLNVVAINRRGQTILAPRPETILEKGDRLIVEGKLEPLHEIQEGQFLIVDDNLAELTAQVLQAIGLAELQLSERTELVGQTLYQAEIRHRFGVNVVAIQRNGRLQQANLQDTRLQAGDRLLLQGKHEPLAALAAKKWGEWRALDDTAVVQTYGIARQFSGLRLPPESLLVGRTLRDSRLGDAFGLAVLAIIRDDDAHLMPEPDSALAAHDILLVWGTVVNLNTLRGLQKIEIVAQTPLSAKTMESEEVGLAEIVLSPQTTLEGKTLRQLHFREKYGLSVLAIWRQGQPHRSDLRDMALRFGDAILLYGRRDKIRLLNSEPDFLVLTEPAPATLRQQKAPLAVGILILILLPVLFGFLPISIAAVVGATLMVLLRCLTMEEAYRYIEWPAVFLIAGMLPLGIAMEQTGAASLIANGVITALGELGPRAIIFGIYLITAVATQIIPTAALVVLMAPIAFNTATDLNISPLPLMMTVAIAASASFSSPVSHPANVMIMGPGGYRFMDYVRVGLPLTLLVMLLTVLLVPIVWSF